MKLTAYPLVDASHLYYNIYIAHPCDITEILPPAKIEPMEFAIGFVQPNLQIFEQWLDTSSEQLTTKEFCGDRIYKLKEGFNFLNLIVPLDQWNSYF